MNNPHKHAALIKQWADGAVIQIYNNDGQCWYDAPLNRPAWHETVTYRIKPVTRKYRVALLEHDQPLLSYGDQHAAMVEKSRCFVRWLTDWTEYEV